MRFRFVRPLLSAVMLLSSPAFAARAVATHKEPPKDAELSKKEATKTPEASLAGDVSRKKKGKNEERPALEYDQFRIGVELQVASKRHEQIDTLQKIIQLGPSEAEAPSLIFRLAELYWEESKAYFFEANRKDDEIFKARANKDEARMQSAEAEKKEILRKSDAYQQNAIAQYRTIVKKYPKYERMDEVLFFLGHNMWESNKEKDAITVYMKLLKDYPKSKYQPDAWVAVGQFFFNNSKGKRDDLDRALQAFKRAETYTDSKVYGYAIYMQGWCLTNLGDFQGAMDKFKSVIYYGELQGKGDSRATSLSREARKDYVSAYAHIGDVMLAKTDFQKVGGEANWWTMLKGLAGLYYEEGKDKEATIVYKQMLNERPLSPEAPFFQGRIVDCVMRVGKKDVTVKQVRELVRVLQEVEKANVAKKDEDKKALQDAKDLAERTLSNLAVTWHNEAKKTRDESVFELAGEVYQDYLSVFAENPKAYDLRFFYAELLNDNLNRYDKAAEEYSRVVAQDVAKIEGKGKDKDGQKAEAEKPGRWLVNAAYNAVLAYDEVAKKEDSKASDEPKGDATKKRTLSPAKKNLLAACERYIKYVPAGEKRVEVMYKAGKILYDHNYFEQAVDILSQIALNNPKHELAEYSANLVLDSFNIQEDWAKVNEWARKFYAVPDLAKGKFKDDLASVLEGSSFKLVNQLEQKNEYGKAAEAYMGFVSEFPKSNLADLALFNASVDYFKGKQIDKSIDVRKHIISSYPNSKYVPQCIFANGEAYEAVADFEAAAEAYELYGNAYSQEKGGGKKKAAPKKGAARKDEAPGPKYEEAKAQTALFNAGVFREGLAQYKEAMKDRNLFLDLWPDGKDSEAVFLSLADLYEKGGATQKALNHLEEYEKKYGSRDADKMLATEYRIARTYEKAGSAKNAQRIYARLLDFYNHTGKAQRAKLGPQSLEAVAKASLYASEPQFAEYARMNLPADERKLKAALKSKQDALVELQKKYTEVVGFKAADPAICSLYKIGLAYKNFADALNAAPVPEMPFPAQLNQIKHLMNVPWNRWPKDYRDALPEADFENIKKQLADAKEQFQQAYKDQINQLAAPVEEKAADAFATTVEKARELNIYNDCAAQAHALLSDKYKPSQYPKVTEMLAELKLANETHEGNGILANVQPIPVMPKEQPQAKAGDLDPPPDFSKPAAKGKGDADPEVGDPAPTTWEKPRKSPGASEDPAPKKAPAKSSTEPDDPDLLK